MLATIIAPMEKTSTPDASLVAKFCKEFLDDNKADDIIVINVEKKFPLADYIIIATGNSARHVISLAQNLRTQTLSQCGVKSLSLIGIEQGDWLLIDLGDVVVHIFQKATRDYYQLEKRWFDN
ncbi:MAG: ribosome silencing factor [Alphaproteobacteria bacterium]